MLIVVEQDCEEAGGGGDPEHEDDHGGCGEAGLVIVLPSVLSIGDNFFSSISVKYISNKELKRIVSSLYERLQLDMSEKFQFFSENPGHGPSTIAILHKVLSSLERNPCKNLRKKLKN